MAHLSRIGNSLGVRIPKAILLQVGFKENANLIFKVTKDGLLIAPVKQARDGWEDAFKTSCKHKKEKPLMGDHFNNEFDKDEWEW